MVKQEAQREQTASMEDYLEAIANLGGGTKVVRVKQISEMLGVKMPSITGYGRSRGAGDYTGSKDEKIIGR